VKAEQQEIRKLLKAPLLALIALTALLGLTIFLAYIPLGGMNLVVSLIIAAAKVAIIVVIFMELPKGTAVKQLAAGVGAFWLLFLFLLAFADYLSR